MSNPYDPNNPNQGEQPSQYGAPIPSGGGGGYGNPYGQSPYGGNEMPKKTDAVSITGFVLSLTCCLSIVGAILGFVGLSRTKGGKRKGRWAAVSATIIGILGTIAGGALIAVFVIFAGSVISVDEAEAGQCANITSDDDDSVLLRDKDCGDDHDAEIVYVGTYDEVENSQFVPSDPDDLTDAGISFGVCTELMDPADVEALGSDVEYQFVTEDSTPSGDEPFFCYVERSNGDKFTSKQLP